MPRKNSKSSKTTQSEKKFTTVPPKVQAIVAKPVVEATPVKSPELTQTKVAVVNNVDAIKPLLNALHDVDADVAREAATSLGSSNNAAAVEPLIEIISNTNGYFHSVVRSAAAASLGELKDRRAVEALLNAVHDPIADPSTEAIRALAVLADPRAINAFIEVVRNSNGFFANSVRRAAVLGLVKLGGDAAIAELRKVSADHLEDSVIREEATTAIPAK